MMERLTKRIDGEAVHFDCHGTCGTCDGCTCFEIGGMVDRLAAYEDTGLSPTDIAALTARAEAAEADLRKCAPCWLCKKKCGIFDALDQRKDGCCPNFEYRGPQAGKGAAPNE